uniref:Large neutral amino acids transporter small subunit 4-like n=1 Tax=Xenopus tropicalis TaxID=8364 RepID=A0A6I8SCA2_XENTR
MGGLGKHWLLGSALAETLLFSGCLLGWNSLSPILLEHGVLFSDCDPGAPLTAPVADTDNGSSQKPLPAVCTLQEQGLNLGFVLGSLFLGATLLPLQILLGYTQLRTVRQTGGALVSVGCLMVGCACTNPHGLSLLLPWALVLLGVGGSCILFTSLMLPLYIGNNEWLYSSMVMGCFTASATVFTLMKVAYNAGVPFVPLLVGYGALSCAMFLNGFFCWGLEQNGEEKKSKYSIQLQLTCCGTGQKAAEKSAWDRESLKYKFETSLRDRERILSRRKKLHFKRPEEPSSPLLRSSLLSPVFVLHLLSDSLLQTWLHFYISSLNLWLQSALYSSLFGALQMVGLFSAPLISILLHRQKETNKGATSKGRLLIGFILQILTAAGFGTACLIQSLGVQVVGFVLHVVTRSSTFILSSALYSCVFPRSHFGALLGIHTCCSALVTVFQHPLFLLLTGPLEGNPFWIHATFLGFCSLSLSVPLSVWIGQRRRRHVSQPIMLQRIRARPSIHTPI